MKSRWLIGAAAAILVMAGCSFGEDYDIAKQAVAAFHQDLNDGNLDAIIEHAVEDFAPDGRRGSAMALLGKVRTGLGKVSGFEVTGFKIKSTLVNGTSVTLTLETTFDKGGATETFVFVMRDGEAVLMNYDIRAHEDSDEASGETVI